MKKLLLVNIAIFTGLFLASNAYSANIEDITPSDNSSIDIVLSEDIVLPKEKIQADIKVLKDLVVSYAYKDTSNAKKIIINLTYALHKNNSYSLLGVIGNDVNADFSIGDEIATEINFLDEKDTKNKASSSTNKLEKIKIVDDKTMELYYSEDLIGDEFIYKVLRDLGTKEVKIKGNYLNLVVKSPLEILSSYILLVNSLSDESGKNINFDEIYYDFVTPESLTEVLEVKKEETSKVEKQVEKKGNIEKVAMNSAKTPATGTATGVLFLIAGLISGFFFIKFKRK